MIDTTTEGAPVDFDALCATIKKFFMDHKVIDNGEIRWWLALPEAIRFAIEEQVTTNQAMGQYLLIIMERYPDWEGGGDVLEYFERDRSWLKVLGDLLLDCIQKELFTETRVKAEAIRRDDRNGGGYEKELAASKKVYHLRRTVALAS